MYAFNPEGGHKAGLRRRLLSQALGSRPDQPFPLWREQPQNSRDQPYGSAELQCNQSQSRPLVSSERNSSERKRCRQFERKEAVRQLLGELSLDRLAANLREGTHARDPTL
jgi:hypothetical protein